MSSGNDTVRDPAAGPRGCWLKCHTEEQLLQLSKALFFWLNPVFLVKMGQLPFLWCSISSLAGLWLQPTTNTHLSIEIIPEGWRTEDVWSHKPNSWAYCLKLCPALIKCHYNPGIYFNMHSIMISVQYINCNQPVCSWISHFCCHCMDVGPCSVYQKNIRYLSSHMFVIPLSLHISSSNICKYVYIEDVSTYISSIYIYVTYYIFHITYQISHITY